MGKKWPSFETKDLGNPPDEAEMQRRWEQYDREMNALIATGTVYQDDEGWWFDKITGEIIGPDPEIERPSTAEELAQARPFREVFPDLAKSIDREIAKRGRPRVDNPKEAVTLRLDPDVVAKFKAKGKNWRANMNEALRKAVGL